MSNRKRGPGHSNVDNKSMPHSERLAVSVAEFAEMFSLSRWHGYNLVKTGKVPVVDFGGRLVIPMRWIREQIESAKPRGSTET